MNNHLVLFNLEARTVARLQALQTLRFEAAYPDLSDLDRLALNVTREILLRLDKRDNSGRVARPELLPASPETIALIETLANLLGETHALDKSSIHYGEENDTCSYCEAINAARGFLLRTKGETP
jgi:hypothetical protein